MNAPGTETSTTFLPFHSLVESSTAWVRDHQHPTMYSDSHNALTNTADELKVKCFSQP